MRPLTYMVSKTVSSLMVDSNVVEFYSSIFFFCDKTTSKTQRHAVNMTPKNWEFGKCSESWKLSVSVRRSDPILKKPEGFFPGGKCGELAIKKSE